MLAFGETFSEKTVDFFFQKMVKFFIENLLVGSPVTLNPSATTESFGSIENKFKTHASGNIYVFF